MHATAVANQAYWNLLRTHHRVIPEVYIMNNQRQILGNATGRLVSGSVDMDSSAATSRSGKITLLDPHNSLGLDFSGHSMGSQYYNRLVQVIYTIQSFDRTVRFSSPVLTGPVVDANRDGVVVNLEVKGMEHFAQDGLLNDSQPGLAGWARSAAIFNAMTVHAGENHFRDDSGGTQVLGAAWSMEKGENMWTRLKELADGMGMQLFYDGAGVCTIRPRPTHPIFTFDTTWLTEEPDMVFEADKIRNVVRVEGANMPTPDGGSARMVYEAWPSPQHPFSPQSLSRNGFPRVIPHHISDEGLASWKDVSDTAWNSLNADLASSGGATAVIVAAPFLEEDDVITINHPKLYANVTLTKWTLPLVGDAEMSINTFSSTSAGFGGRSNYVSNAAVYGGRMSQPGVRHGDSGAFSTFGPSRGTKGQNAYNGGPGKGGFDRPKKGKKGKKKNRGKK